MQPRIQVGKVSEGEGLIPAFLSLMLRLMGVMREEEERLKEEFPGVRVSFDTDSVPFRVVVVYDFLKLDKEARYRFFDFKRRLLDRIENILSEHFGEEISVPLEVEFVRNNGK